jgi:methylmalonyl-CoA/ethylmalonyl-CoA epimerase
MLPPNIAKIGTPLQLAFVTRTPEPELKFWSSKFGAGPFFEIRNLNFNFTLYRGTNQDVTIDAYIGYWRDLQIEVIRPHDDTPSVYSEWLNEGGTGLHHIAMTVENLETARRAIEAAGLEVTQESAAYNGEPFLYARMGGIYLEIICPDAGMRAFFEMMRDAHVGWDGQDPVRSAPSEEVSRGGVVKAMDRGPS